MHFYLPSNMLAQTVFFIPIQKYKHFICTSAESSSSAESSPRSQQCDGWEVRTEDLTMPNTALLNYGTWSKLNILMVQNPIL